MKSGEKVKIFRKIARGYKERELIFVSESSHSIRFTNGNYPVTVNKADIITGDIGIESGDFEMKITPEQLLEECKEHGTTPEAKETIAKKYGCTIGTLKFYFCKWEINKKLNEGKNNNQEVNKNMDSKQNKEMKEDIPEVPETSSEKIKNAEKGLNVKLLLLHGNMMNYRINEKGISIHRTDTRDRLFLKFNEIDTFINELKEVQHNFNIKIS